MPKELVVLTLDGDQIGELTVFRRSRAARALRPAREAPT
jgi:hypothetical protein